jgi:hypothetical protein
MSQVKLDRKYDISVRSWINEKPITDDSWNVFYTEGNSEMLIVLVDEKSNNQVKIEVVKRHQHEDSKEENK